MSRSEFESVLNISDGVCWSEELQEYKALDGYDWQRELAEEATLVYMGWRAARGSVVVRLPEPIQANPDPLGELVYAQRCRKVIEDLGITVE